MKRVCSIAICLLGLTLACKEQAQEVDYGPAEYTIGIRVKEDTLRLSSLYASARQTRLSGCTISHISKVIRTSHGYVLFGKFGDDKNPKLSQVAAFSEDGRFQQFLVLTGRANNEMLNVQSVQWNPFTGQVEVLGNYGADIYAFSPSDNWKLNEVKHVPEGEIQHAEDFIPETSDRYFFYKNLSYIRAQEYKVYEYDFAGDSIVNRYIPLDKKKAELLSISQRNNLYRCGDAVYFTESFDPHIYRFDGQGIHILAEEERNEYSIPDDFSFRSFGDDLLKFINTCKSGNFIWNRRNYVHDGDTILSYFQYKDGVYLNVMDLTSQDRRSFTHINDDMITNTIAAVSRWSHLFLNAQDGHCYLIVDESLTEQSDMQDATAGFILVDLT